jgi:2-polyprenyl-3-methyl-5-hydroxy-6-metoxy-1,4-benzoquinol methylase
MLAPRVLEFRYADWNHKWRAPFGRLFFKRFIPEQLWRHGILGNLVGVFSHQPNSDTRIFEYPWAFFATDLQKGMKVLDIGGGYSGFSFVLAKLGLDVTVVDPFLSYDGRNHYCENPREVFDVLNRIYKTNVNLIHDKLDRVELKQGKFDRIFCISVFEHLSETDQASLLSRMPGLLKRDGYFIATIDLFLNLHPFTKRLKNEYGMNISIKQLVDQCGLALATGDPKELFGFQDFDAHEILSNLEKYYIGHAYPVLIQSIVLKIK